MSVHTSDDWGDFPQVIGKLSPELAARKLEEIDDDDAATLLEATPTKVRGFLEIDWPFQDRPWQYTSHKFGYLANPKPGETGALKIREVASIAPDLSLKGKPIVVRLNRLRVAKYPGGGTHNVLFEFQAKNVLAQGGEETVSFSGTYRVKEGQTAAVQGYPIFVGLNVGDLGLSLHCRTVNVKNEEDEAVLAIMESETFRSGLSLVSAAQPAIKPLSELVTGLAKSIAKRHRNTPVQEFLLGLDFDDTPMGGRLAQGSYIVVQAPDEKPEEPPWSWDEWVYHPEQGRIVKATDPGVTIPFNYVVFSVTKM